MIKNINENREVTREEFEKLREEYEKLQELFEKVRKYATFWKCLALMQHNLSEDLTRMIEVIKNLYRAKKVELISDEVFNEILEKIFGELTMNIYSRSETHLFDRTLWEQCEKDSYSEEEIDNMMMGLQAVKGVKEYLKEKGLIFDDNDPHIAEKTLRIAKKSK